MNKYPLILVLLSLIACKEISFEAPQPKSKKSLNAVPLELQGSYLLSDDNGVSKDTLVVTAKGYRSGHNLNEEALLSDSMVLKSYKGYYFLNLNERPEWLLRVFKKEKNGDLICMSMEQEGKDFNAYLSRLSHQIKIDSLVRQGETLYQIDPSPRELVNLIKKGFFKKTTLKKLPGN